MVTKTLRVLEAFRAGGPQLSLNEVINVCGLPKASAYRILETLRYCGYVSRTKFGLYRLTFKLLDVAGVVQEHSLLREVALPFMEKLRRKTGETVNLGVFEGNEVIYADVLESSYNLRMVPRVGSAAPLHATALGKSIAALLPVEEIAMRTRNGRMRRYTEKTIISDASLLEEFARVRERGYAIDDEEEAGGCTCIGAAILDARGRILGAISVSAPSSRTTPKHIARIGSTVRDTARAISERFGFVSETRSSVIR
jgi:IclR family acetate operon transcriptional repressor